MAVSSQRVLVAEDDDSMREALERLLGAAGCESSAHASAEAALDGHTGDQPARIVCHLRLPGMSGFELLDELRGRGWSVPFIVIAPNLVSPRSSAPHDGLPRTDLSCRGRRPVTASDHPSTQWLSRKE